MTLEEADGEMHVKALEGEDRAESESTCAAPLDVPVEANLQERSPSQVHQLNELLKKHCVVFS